ncbi:MAG: acyl-ACP--UDP-N-acetylglucosamine O-acyltransferase [Methylacidiphilales bacterium]|nr:acyl-ACP--UDP-N-acetylglucosamine O-acyltransferase [Candidatus Methylacidiphilales bacterium]
MSTQIHGTAIIDGSARLGTGVKVGPYAIIEEDCVIGNHCEVRAHAIICRGTVMGDRNQIGYGTVLGAEPQDYGYKGGASRVEIGSGNRIREYVTIHRASKEGSATVVGNENFIMGGVHLGHDVRVGNRSVLANNTLLSGYVQVGDRVFLGGATIVHQFTRIGDFAITRGGTRLGKDVPPYFMAVATNQVSGINRIGLRRAGFSHETRRTIQAAYDLIYRSNLNVSQALEELRHKFHLPEIARLVDFVAASKRGICRERGAGGGDGDEE